MNNASLDVVKQPRIKDSVTRQEQIEQYDNKGIDKTSEKKAFVLPLNNKVFSFHGGVGKEVRHGESYWLSRVEKKGETKEFFKGGGENLDWILKKDIGLLFMKTQTWFDILKAGVGVKFEGSPVGWLEFWRSDIFLKFADFDAGEKFWKEYGVEFSENGVGKEFLRDNKQEFSETEAGKEFLVKHELKLKDSGEGGEGFLISKEKPQWWTTFSLFGIATGTLDSLLVKGIALL